MSIIHPVSLSSTIDSASAELFFHNPIAPGVRKDLVAMLIGRQILSGSNSGFFLPFTAESQNHLQLFTGETLHTEFAIRHNLLIESTRLLVLLADGDAASIKSIKLADTRMNSMCYSKFCSKGECKPLSIAYMRYLSALNNEKSISRLRMLLTKLSEQRDGKGRWHVFPIFYTVLMLSEVHDPLAAQELEYAAPTFEKLSQQIEPDNFYTKRRQSILNAVMNRSEYDANPLLLGEHG
jgi:hypothetical protein